MIVRGLWQTVMLSLSQLPTSIAMIEKGSWKLSAIEAITLPHPFRTITPTPARLSSLNTAPSKLTLSFDQGRGFQISRGRVWLGWSGGCGGMPRTKEALAFCTYWKICWIGKGRSFVLMKFRRYQIAHTVVAKRFKSLPVSMICSTKSRKLAKCGVAL